MKKYIVMGLALWLGACNQEEMVIRDVDMPQSEATIEELKQEVEENIARVQKEVSKVDEVYFTAYRDWIQLLNHYRSKAMEGAKTTAIEGDKIGYRAVWNKESCRWDYTPISNYSTEYIFPASEEDESSNTVRVVSSLDFSTNRAYDEITHVYLKEKLLSEVKFYLEESDSDYNMSRKCFKAGAYRQEYYLVNDDRVSNSRKDTLISKYWVDDVKVFEHYEALDSDRMKQEITIGDVRMGGVLENVAYLIKLYSDHNLANAAAMAREVTKSYMSENACVLISKEVKVGAYYIDLEFSAEQGWIGFEGEDWEMTDMVYRGGF